ncbi:transcriptional regulator with XRE-family HTH domain [Bradyrhizobium sp. USDA 4341]
MKGKKVARKAHSPRSSDETDVYVGGRIRSRRLELELSQEVLGQRVGISFQQVQKYEKGLNRVGAGRIRQLAEVLEVSPAYFFEGMKTVKGAVQVTAMDLFAKDSFAIRLAKAFPLLSTEGKRNIVEIVEQLAGVPQE